MADSEGEVVRQLGARDSRGPDHPPPPRSDRPSVNNDGRMLTHRRIMLALSGLMIGNFIAALDQTIVATALPAIVTDLGGLSYFSWVIVGYLLTSTASTPLWGKVGDLFGRRNMFQLATVVFLLGSLLCGLAPTMLVLVGGRLVQGIGGGGLQGLCFAIVGDLVPPRQRGKYIGYFAGIFAVAGISGPLIGGIITDTIGWRWIFTINVPFGVASLVVVAMTLHLPSTRRSARLDLVGASLLVIGVACVVLCSVWGGGEYAWSSKQIVALGTAAALLLTAFIIWETRAAEPVLPLRLFRNRLVRLLLAIAFLTGPLFFASPTFIPLFMQGVDGLSATTSGLMLAPHAIGVSVAAIVTGRLTTRTGRYKHWLVGGAALLLLDMAALSQIEAGWSYWLIGALMLLTGVGLGAALPVLSTASQNAVDLADLGVVSSSGAFFRSLGGTFGVAAFGAVLKSRFDAYLVDIASTTQLPAGATARGLADHPEQIRDLPQPLQDLVQRALASSVGAVFLAAVPLSVVILGLSLLVRERPLRETTTYTATPGDDSLDARVTAMSD